MQAADSAIPRERPNTILLGPDATESAFKRVPILRATVIIHLAVHGFASPTWIRTAPPWCWAATGRTARMGFWQASEIVQMRLNADLVVLSACDSALGPIDGIQEGIAALSRAFLLAGARSGGVDLWSIDDTFSSSL